MTDEELLKATVTARRAAHDAPKAMGSGSRAWADRANDWMRLAAEVDRRGLTQPSIGSPLSHGKTE